MTHYDQIAGHPLAGVPQVVLNTARAVLGQARDADLHDTDDRNALADAITLALHQSLYLRWETSAQVPDRESLILRLNLAINGYLSDEDARRRGTVVEAVVDQVVLPLLRPPRLPDRESLVLACQSAAWEVEEHTSIMEAIVDVVILPLLRRVNGEHGTSATDDDGRGVRRADAGT